MGKIKIKVLRPKHIFYRIMWVNNNPWWLIDEEVSEKCGDNGWLYWSVIE